MLQLRLGMDIQLQELPPLITRSVWSTCNDLPIIGVLAGYAFSKPNLFNTL
jgi:hypothetical protein